jgi:2'-5' RNA ligase
MNVENEKMRLFVAISVPEEIRAKIAASQEELRQVAPRSAVRWTISEQLHLTLRFLGDVPVAKLLELKESIRQVCGQLPVLHLKAAGIGFFPNARSPRVIWAGIADADGRLGQFQKEIEKVAGPFAEKPGAEKFVGHLTMGRFKVYRPGEIKELVNRAMGMGGRQFGEWTAGEVEIVRSELLQGGARHTVMEAFPLGRAE